VVPTLAVTCSDCSLRDIIPRDERVGGKIVASGCDLIRPSLCTPMPENVKQSNSDVQNVTTFHNLILKNKHANTSFRRIIFTLATEVCNFFLPEATGFI
jgi:hypothetical protein